MGAPVFISREHLSGLGIFTPPDPSTVRASSITTTPPVKPATFSRDQSNSAAISIQGWLSELETFAKNAHNYVVQAEQAMLNTYLAPDELARSIANLQTSIHNYATQAQSRYDSILDTAGSDPALASFVSRAKAAQGGLTVSVQRVDQLAVQAASANSGDAATGQYIIGGPVKKGFPMWGYVAVGVVFIGGALLLTGKKG